VFKIWLINILKIFAKKRTFNQTKKLKVVFWGKSNFFVSIFDAV